MVLLKIYWKRRKNL